VRDSLATLTAPEVHYHFATQPAQMRSRNKRLGVSSVDGPVAAVLHQKRP
jgi:hypothetical protein